MFAKWLTFRTAEGVKNKARDRERERDKQKQLVTATL